MYLYVIYVTWAGVIRLISSAVSVAMVLHNTCNMDSCDLPDMYADTALLIQFRKELSHSSSYRVTYTNQYYYIYIGEEHCTQNILYYIVSALYIEPYT